MFRSNKRKPFQTDLETIALGYLNELFCLALYLTRDKVDAEDLVQETYLKARRFFKSFRSKGDFRVRIHKSLYSNFIAFRRKETNPSGVEIVSKSMSVPEQAKKEADSFCQRYQEILQDEVGQALERIPEENRTVILLTDMQGFSSKEAAKILKCSMSTLWSRLSVARKKLHGFLNLSN